MTEGGNVGKTPLTDAAEIDESHFSDWGCGPSGYVNRSNMETLELALQRRDALLREALRELIPKPNRYPNDLIARIESELKG